MGFRGIQSLLWISILGHAVHAHDLASTDPSLTQAPAPDICTQPYEAVCKRPPRQNAGIVQKSKIQALIPFAAGTTPALDVYADVQRDVFNAILTEAAPATGIGIEDIKRQFERMHAVLMANATSAERAKLIDTKIVLPNELAQRPLNEKLVSSYYRICGLKGLSEDGFYSPSLNVVIICSGLILKAINSPARLSEMDAAILHEQTHAISAIFGISPLSRYESFTNCIERGYGKDLNSLSSILEYIDTKSTPTIKARLAEAESRTPVPTNDVLFWKRALAFAADERSRLEKQLNKYSQLYSQTATAAQSHTLEMFPDAMAAIGIQQMAGKIAPDEFKRRIVEQLEVFCVDDANERYQSFVYGVRPDDGTHPEARVRVEMSLSAPTLRKALGCTTPAPRPWCSPLAPQ